MPASTFMEIWNSNESSFEHLLTYLGLSINVGQAPNFLF